MHHRFCQALCSRHVGPNHGLRSLVHDGLKYNVHPFSCAGHRGITPVIELSLCHPVSISFQSVRWHTAWALQTRLLRCPRGIKAAAIASGSSCSDVEVYESFCCCPSSKHIQPHLCTEGKNQLSFTPWAKIHSEPGAKRKVHCKNAHKLQSKYPKDRRPCDQKISKIHPFIGRSIVEILTPYFEHSPMTPACDTWSEAPSPNPYLSAPSQHTSRSTVNASLMSPRSKYASPNPDRSQVSCRR